MTPRDQSLLSRLFQWFKRGVLPETREPEAGYYASNNPDRVAEWERLERMANVRRLTSEILALRKQRADAVRLKQRRSNIDMALKAKLGELMRLEQGDRNA